MDSVPNFCLQSRSSVRASTEAAAFACRPNSAATTMDDAKARAMAGGGDCSDTKLVLSQYEMQFGKYRGQSFHWLLSNNVGYIVMILAVHQQKHGPTEPAPLCLIRTLCPGTPSCFPVLWLLSSRGGMCVRLCVCVFSFLFRRGG
eukprot:superscaffoldBa00000071_g1116